MLIGQADIKLDGFQFWVKRKIICLLIKDIALTKIGSDKSFTSVNKCGYW